MSHSNGWASASAMYDARAGATPGRSTTNLVIDPGAGLGVEEVQLARIDEQLDALPFARGRACVHARDERRRARRRLLVELLQHLDAGVLGELARVLGDHRRDV